MTQLVLPEFEGRMVYGTKTTVTGQTGDRTRPFKLEERLYICAEVTVTSVDHGLAEGGIVRKHVLKVSRMAEMDDAMAEEILSYAEAEARRAADEAQGREPLFDDDGNPVTDGDLAIEAADLEPAVQEPEPVG